MNTVGKRLPRWQRLQKGLFSALVLGPHCRRFSLGFGRRLSCAAVCAPGLIRGGWAWRRLELGLGAGPWPSPLVPRAVLGLDF